VFKPHRLAVTNEKGELFNIVSQSDVVSFAFSNSAKLGDKRTKTLRELNLVRACIMVRIDSSFSDSLQILYQNRVSGIALVDHEGRLSGNFSASDLRGILPEAFSMFYGSILQYLVKGTQSHPHQPITCSESSTLEDVLRLLVTNRIHRVYVVDQFDRPIGLVSIADIVTVLREGQ